jgi:fumarate reductase subunit C
MSEQPHCHHCIKEYKFIKDIQLDHVIHSYCGSTMIFFFIFLIIGLFLVTNNRETIEGFNEFLK